MKEGRKEEREGGSEKDRRKERERYLCWHIQFHYSALAAHYQSYKDPELFGCHLLSCKIASSLLNSCVGQISASAEVLSGVRPGPCQRREAQGSIPVVNAWTAGSALETPKTSHAPFLGHN